LGPQDARLGEYSRARALHRRRRLWQLAQPFNAGLGGAAIPYWQFGSGGCRRAGEEQGTYRHLQLVKEALVAAHRRGAPHCLSLICNQKSTQKIL
jgi:hypothetical protein